MEEGPGCLRLRGREKGELSVRHGKCEMPHHGLWGRAKAGTSRSGALGDEQELLAHRSCRRSLEARV